MSADPPAPGPVPPAIAVAIIEGQRVIRDGLAALIDGADRFRCAGAWRPVEEALPRVARSAPRVLLLDIGLPALSGIDGIPALERPCPGLLILILTVFDDDERIFGALCAGADGYLHKKTSPARLLEAVRRWPRAGLRCRPASPGA